MKKTPEFEDVIRIYTSEGEQIIPLSQVRAVLRKTPQVRTTDGRRLLHHFAPPPAVGIELRNGKIIWSDGETDWYYSGEPARVGR